MKYRLLLGIVAVVGFASHADAMDVAATTAPAAPFNWTGFYIGGNAGYSWSDTDVSYVQSPGNGADFGVPFSATGFSRSFSPNGNSFMGGGQIGYNHQAGNWLLGVETDFQWRKVSGSYLEIFQVHNDQLTLQSDERWFGTLRARLGWAAGNWLFYGTGGFAYGEFKDSLSQLCNNLCNVLRTRIESHTRPGWVIGGGVEAALWQNWTLGAEYLLLDFSDNTISADESIALVAPILSFPATTVRFHHRFHVARFKLNYRF